MSRTLRTAAIAVLALMVGALFSASASANTPVNITPGGAITATFATNGIIFDAGIAQANCPLTLTGTLLTSSVVLADGLLSVGNITGGTPTTPCNGLAIRLLLSASNPWLISLVSLNADGRANVRILNVQVSSSIFGITCLFSGNVNATINGGSITNPSGTLSPVSGPCGDATVGGNGGTLSPSQTITRA